MINKELEINKDMQNKQPEIKKIVPIKKEVEAKKVEIKNKELCKKCPELIEEKLQARLAFEKEKSEKEWQLTKLRETILRMDRKYDQLMGESIEYKKRREWDKGLIQGAVLGFSATIGVLLVVCAFLSLFHVI